MNRIMITGASGSLGKLIVDELLKMVNPDQVAVLIRDKDKATQFKVKAIKIHIGNYDDYESLITAFTGIWKLYLVSGNDLVHRAKQHQNVIKAATSVGVKHIFYSSFQRKKENTDSPIFSVMASHLAAEKEIMDSGITYTILKHGVYSNMLPIYLGQHFLENQTIVFPAGNGKVSYASREDMAVAGARMLLHSGNDYDNRSVELAGLSAQSFHDIAKIFGEITGKPFSYLSPDLRDYASSLRKTKMPEEIIELTCAFADSIAKGELNCPDPLLEQILGRTPESIRDFFVRTYQLARH